jgi:chemotaxis protein MotB
LFGALAAMSTGCVSKDEYDKAVTAARIARQELDSANGRLQAALMDNKNLKDQNGLLASQMKNKDAIIKSLQASNDDLAAKLKDVTDKYIALAGKGPDILVRNVSALPAGLDEKMKEVAKNYPELFDWDSRLGMLRVKADMTFAPGSTEIKPEAAAALAKLAEIFNGADFQPYCAYIAGHTDDMPLSKEVTKEQHGSNWGLSAHRSLAVIKLLAENRVDQARMAGLEFSKYQPVAPNAAGNKGNASNRRVEIWIVPPDRFLTTPAGMAPAKAEETAVPEKAVPEKAAPAKSSDSETPVD